MMAGDVMGQLGDMRNSMEDNVTQNFLVPITDVQVRPTGNQMQTLDAPFNQATMPFCIWSVFSAALP